MVANIKEVITERLNQAFARIPGLAPGRGQHQRIATKFRVSRETARKWTQGEALPEVWRIVEIGIESELGPAYILLQDSWKGLNENSPARYFSDEREQELGQLFRSANEEGQRLILATVIAIAKQHPKIFKAGTEKKGAVYRKKQGGTG